MASSKADTAEISTENYQFLQQQVYRASGIVLDDTKQYLLEARLLPIIRREKLGGLNDLCALMRATARPEIAQEITEAMTTNETFFFRDLTPFNALRNTILPRLKAEKKLSRVLRLWSAASSSGQEAYSLAMLLLESGFEDFRIDILGTDLSEKMIERARAGRYIQIEVNRGLPAPYLVKYFDRKGLEWQLKEVVRRMVRFQQFDLRQPMTPLGTFDIVFCRNVLIYFDLDTRKKVLNQIEGTLASGACLFLGAAETTMNLTTAFEYKSADGAIFYQKR